MKKKSGSSSNKEADKINPQSAIRNPQWINPVKPKIIVICGPTGIGKTAVAVELARAFGGEIVGADSVITSYSIHYTKLYENRCSARR